MVRAHALLLLPLAVLLSACPGPVDTGPDGGATGPFTVGASGGQFIRDGVYFDIPNGAVGSDTVIQVTVIDTGIPEVPGRKRVSYGFQISPQNLVFQTPITIGLGWLQDRVPGGVQPKDFDMRRKTATDAYLALPSPSVVTNPLATDQQAITAKSDRLGTFWITSPAQPAVNEIKLDPENAPILRVGDTQQFTAQVLDPGGSPIDGAKVTWSVVAPRIAKVDENGLVTALDPGVATLTVSAGTVSKTVELHVQGTTKGPVTFVHDNPFPTGNNLWGGAISNGYSFFVGGNATVLSRSPTDQWTRLFSSPAITLKAAAGNFPSSAVAVGTSLDQGVLIEVNGTATPTIKTFATSQPRAVWFDGTYGMAVGDGNDVLIRSNGAWTTEYSPSFEGLMSVVGDGAGGFVTVGNLGSLYKYDPVTKVWNSLFQTRLSVLLLAGVIADSAGSEAWAVGGNKLWHFQNSAWSAISLPTTPVVTGLDAIGIVDGKIVVGASKGTSSYILTYEPVGGTWTTTNVHAPLMIRGVFGSGSKGYAVGDYGAVYEYANGVWTEKSHGLYGDVADIAVTGTTVVVAMNECADTACQTFKPRVVTRNSSGDWVSVGGDPQPFFGDMTAVAAKGPNEIYAATTFGLFVWNGTSWGNVSVTSGTPSFNDIAICGADLWAVGNGGVEFKGTGSSGIISTVGATSSGAGTTNLFAVTCPTATDIWVAGDGVLLENRVKRESADINQATWRSVWSPGSGEAFAFGDARFGVYWDTAKLNLLDTPGGVFAHQITGMWGSKPDNLYAIGQATFPATYSFAIRTDGANWYPIDLGAERVPTAIHGSSDTEIWIGTKGGGILRGVTAP